MQKKYCDHFETERLIIRRFEEKDSEDLREYAIYKTGTGFEAWESWPTDSASCLDLAKFFASSNNYWAVCRKSDSKTIGLISFNQIDEVNHLDMGHGFTLAYNQNGEDVEAMKVMIQYAFDELDIKAVDARNEIEWKEQVAPLFMLGFVQLEDRMQMTRELW